MTHALYTRLQHLHARSRDRESLQKLLEKRKRQVEALRSIAESPEDQWQTVYSESALKPPSIGRLRLYADGGAQRMSRFTRSVLPSRSEADMKNECSQLSVILHCSAPIASILETVISSNHTP